METSSYGGGGPAADDAQVWDRVRTVRLIEMWSQSPALFDSTCLDYRNKYQRTAALNAIANELGLQDSEIRDKMRNLRSQYAREKTHEQKSTLPPSLASCFAYKSKWFYFRMLSFLDDFKRHVRSDSGSSRGNANVIGNPDADSMYSNQASLTPGTDGGQDDADCAEWAQSPQAEHVTSASAAAALESHSRSEGSDCGDGGCGSGYTSGPSAASGRLAAGSGVAFAGRRGGSTSVAVAAAVGSHTGAKRRKMNTRKLVLRRCPAAATTEAAAVGLGVSAATAGGDLRSRGTSESGDELNEELKEEPDGEEHDGYDAMAALTERLPVPVKLTCATKEEDEEQDDDEELFGRFVASELRKVASVRLKAVAKLRMHEALLDATAVASWQRDGPPVPAAATAAAVAGSGTRRRM